MKSLLFLLASTLLVVIACGSSSTAKGNSATNACTLLTQAEVSAAVGAAVNAGVYEGPGAPNCTWTAASGAAATLNYPEDPGQVGQIPAGAQHMSGVSLVKVDGLGDAADYTVVGTISAELDVRKGSQAFQMDIGNDKASQAQIEAGEKTLATLVLTRI